jgi:putative aldouronate transport system permease protein
VEHRIKKKSVLEMLKKQKYLFLLLLPALIILVLFSYTPMTGLYMAFTNYLPTNRGYFHDLLNAPFVGLQWFRFFWETDLFLVLRNTLVISLLSLLIGFPIPILIAIFLNEIVNKRLRNGLQTASYLPYFISWVIAASMMRTMFAANGPINDMLLSLNLINERVLFFQDGRFFWWIIALSNTWKGMGYSAIIYLAAIAGISQDQFEAAEIDGAHRWQKILYITLPSLKPTIILIFILAVGGVLNTGFEQIFLLQNAAIFNYSDVFDTYTFRFGMQNGMFSYATAVGLIRSVVSFGLVVTANAISKRLGQSSLY